MVPGLLGLVVVEGIAFRSEVAEACLDVCAADAAESHVYPYNTPLAACMLLKYLALLGICTVVWGVVWMSSGPLKLVAVQSLYRAYMYSDL